MELAGTADECGAILAAETYCRLVVNTSDAGELAFENAGSVFVEGVALDA